MDTNDTQLYRPNAGSADVQAAVNISALADLVEHCTGGKDGHYEMNIPGLNLYRYSKPTKPDFFIQETALCFVVQGRKKISVGSETYTYDPSTSLVVSVDLSINGQILNATPDKPYLGIILKAQLKDLATLLIETRKKPAKRNEWEGQGLYLSPIVPSMSDALIRLLKLLDAPEEISILAPMIIREIHFRMLQTEQFGILSQAAMGDGKLRRVSTAIDWLKTNLDKPLKIEELAKQVNMSESGLHHRFKEVTSLSPLQFQKRLRLQKARQLLMTDKTNIEKVAYQVGYESPSQFSREYTRLFGQSPLRDANRLRENPDNVEL